MEQLILFYVEWQRPKTNWWIREHNDTVRDYPDLSFDTKEDADKYIIMRKGQLKTYKFRVVKETTITEVV